MKILKALAMKSFFTILFLLPFCLFAQENSWFEPNSTWTYNYGNISGPDHYQATFGITETTFAGKACAKMDMDNFPFMCFPVSSPYYFYESNDSIFFATGVDSTFQLAFDFNAQPGDSWTYNVPVEMTNSVENFQVNVLAVNEMDIDGNTVKELVLTYINLSLPPHSVEIYPEEISVLEFIGAIPGFFIPLGRISACDYETGLQIQCFESPTLQYTNPEFGSCILALPSANSPVKLKIYPNPARDYINIHSDISVNSILRIRQLDGKVVYTEMIDSKTERIKLPALSAGMYMVEVSTDEIKHYGKLQIE